AAPPPSIEEVPDWATLFGSLDLCACAACGSVHGPAAYLVDLLHHVLKSQPSTDARFASAQAVLLARRPDIGMIELTCANGDTPLPYVDLVNEVLENAVAPSGAPPEWQSGITTDGTPAERAVSPQYLNRDAYEQVLGKQVYPPSLPFELWLEEARTCLEQLGARRDQVIATFQRGLDPATTAADREYLRISAPER